MQPCSRNGVASRMVAVGPEGLSAVLIAYTSHFLCVNFV